MRQFLVLVLALSVVFGASLASIETIGSNTSSDVPALGMTGSGNMTQAERQRPQTLHLAVYGLDISEDVAQATEDDPDFYLTHDLEGNTSSIGVAFCDYRSSEKSRHTIIYGHNLSGTDKMFSPLRTAWEPRTFQKIQGAELTTKTGATVKLRPLFARRIDASDQEIQRFDFGSSKDFATWLRSVAEHADVLTPESDKLIKRANSCVSLITCASVRPHQRERTLVIFVPVR